MTTRILGSGAPAVLPPLFKDRWQLFRWSPVRTGTLLVVTTLSLLPGRALSTPRHR